MHSFPFVATLFFIRVPISSASLGSPNELCFPKDGSMAFL